MRAVIYARYSAGPRQTDQSIEGQVRVCTDFCKEKGLTVTEIYADRHISGRSDDRPEFQRLITDAKKRKFEAVVVYKTDRFARDKYDSAVYKRQLRNNGVQIYYAAEAIPEGPEGIILESLMEGLAEYYSAELAQKIRRGMHESALKCKVMGRTVPIGYRVSAEKTYEIDPEGEKAVHEIFKMYIDRKTNADICEWLNGHGFRTSAGGKFNKNSINRIIKNEKYIGVYQHGEVRVEGGVPAIISDETYRLAQKEMARRKTGKQGRRDAAEYMLTGKLFCGHCGKAMTGVSGTGKSGRKFYYYYCPTARGKGACDKEPVARDYIEDVVVEATCDYIVQPDVLENLAHWIWQEQEKRNTREQDIVVYRKKLAENKKAIENVVAAVEKGLGTTTLLERLEALEVEQTAIEGEIAYLQTASFGRSEVELQFFLLQFLRQGTESREDYKRRIIRSFITKIYLYNDRFTIHYKVADDETLQFDKKDLDLCRPDVFDERLARSTFRASVRPAPFFDSAKSRISGNRETAPLNK